jgi:proteasome lid subunit RPN8/RPN11
MERGAVGRRVDVDETLPPVAIPGRILNELYAHARETLPEECCGLILGDDRERFRRLLRCRNEMTQRHHDDPHAYPHDNHAGFYMSALDYQRAAEQAEAAGESVTAVYHSHVGAEAYLSETDLEYAENAFFPFPSADQIVVAVVSGPPPSFEGRRVTGIGIFQRDGVGCAFLGRPVRSQGP